MNANDPTLNLPSGVVHKLQAIQRRRRWLTFLEGLARTGAIFIVAMLAAMLIDLAVGWFDPRARYTITGLSLVLGGFFFVLWCALPLGRKRTIVSTARDVDETIPQLEERWSTVTELAQSKDAPAVRGSERMIRKVAAEADLAGAGINPQSVVSEKPALRAGQYLLGATAALALLYILNFNEARVLLHRFWLPGDNVSLTKLSVAPNDCWVPRGEPLTIRTKVQGRVPKSAPTLSVQRASGLVKKTAMSSKAGEAGVFQHPIDAVTDSFAYQVQAGDGQTPWQRITAVDRPQITAVKLTVTPPEYSQLAKEEKDALPNALRVLQGSEVSIAFQSNQPLDKMLLDLGNGQSVQLSAEDDHWYRYQARPAESFTFAAVALNKYQLVNTGKPACRVSVYEDLAPTVKILAPSDELAVLPGEKVQVSFEATDDFGIARAEVEVTATTADGETKTVTLPVDLQTETGKKQARGNAELDPKALGLKHGDQLTYVVKVTDTKQNPGQIANAPQSLAKTSGANQQPQAAQDSTEEGSKSEAQKADGAEKVSETSEPTELANSTPKPQEQKENETASGSSSPPPNDMSKRMLDAGQCTACKPRNITVDEWAGTFEGEKRKKLEIAIAPVLEHLDKLLKQADERTDGLKLAAAMTEGLQERHVESLAGAKANLAEVEGSITGLKSRTTGSPYAFIGLQLDNIDKAHVTPAFRSLHPVAIGAVAAGGNVEPLGRASFHIGRAIEMLADLTRSFEKVKRDQQIADAMQKLAKMHQLFIEDTQAMLGNSPGPLNSYDRKIAEVDEQFVEKLKALLEEKKKIMAELSKLLGEDPRLLRRYLAMQQMQCASYRDQMTLLAERQKNVQQQIAKWNAAPEMERAALLPALRQSYTAEQQKLVKDATTLRENLETWLPLDVKPETKQVETALRQAEKVVELAAQERGEQALEASRALRAHLSQLNQLVSKDKPRMTAYVANRSVELESLIAANAGHLVMMKSLDSGDFVKVAEIVQHGVTHETTTLGEKLKATEKQVGRLSEEIAGKAELLNKTVQADIISPQGKSLEQLAKPDIQAAGEVLDRVVPAFGTAEQTFDELMRLIIAKLDAAPPPTAPGQAPELDALLAMLQDEMKACESLGIPCRPMNVSLMSDWMKPSSGTGQGMGQAQAKAAQAQAQQGKGEAERLEKQARESAKRALTDAQKDAKSPTGEVVAETSGKRAPAWNKLASKLQKDLLQGRDNVPPEQYRAAIDQYFRVLSETTAPAK